jgi:hypothetical protein
MHWFRSGDRPSAWQPAGRSANGRGVDRATVARRRPACFNPTEGTAMNRWFYGFFFIFPRLLAEGNG